MRPTSALLAVCAVSALPTTLAVPSPFVNPPQQRVLTQQPTTPAPSRWHRLTNTLLSTLWRRPCTPSTPQPHPPHPYHYGSDVVLRFNVSTRAEAHSLARAADTLLLDVWESSRDWVDIRVAADMVGPMLGLLPESLQYAHTPLMRERELAEAIFNTYPTAQRAGDFVPEGSRHFALERPKGGAPEGNIFFADYQPLSVIEPWMRLMASLFTSHVRKIHIGTSAQGRDISALRVGVHPTLRSGSSPTPRRTVLVTGGLHAREWISTSTVTYLAYSLITGYGKSAHITSLLSEFDFVFIPTLNPDGYAYTWETDRLWRKNRQPTSLRFCRGIDLDRSFGFAWDAGAPSNPCSESFPGSAAFAGVEARALADWATNETTHNAVQFAAYLDLHSYSQEILYPYSYTCSVSPPGLENLEELAIGMEKAIRLVHGQGYDVLSACQGNVAALESAAGSALDWFHHEADVKFAYQVKLRDRGSYGFLLPKEQIVAVGKETLAALEYLGGFLSEAHEPN